MAEISTIQFLNEEGILSETFTRKVSDEVLIKGLQTMLKTRLVDEKMITLQRQGIITFAMSSLGEEACSVAAAAALDLSDWIYPQYREAGVMFWRGFSIEKYVHQMFGDAKDLILGRQMPNHFGSRELNVVTVSSPIGTKFPHAAGAAYAMRYKRDAHVVLCIFGEGATSEGDFHVGVNFAAVRKVPCIFFCRNNGYAISTPFFRQFAGDGVASKGEGYGIPAYRIDGNDFLAIYDTVTLAKQKCLEGQGPILIEAMTYRMSAHSTSDDPTLYRKEEEVAIWTKKDPVLRLKKYLEGKNLWSSIKEKEFLETVHKELDQAIETAKKTPRPPLPSLIENVYFETPLKLKEELEEIKFFFPEG